MRCLNNFSLLFIFGVGRRQRKRTFYWDNLQFHAHMAFSHFFFGRHHRNHIIQFPFLQVFNVFYLFFLRQRVYFISENAICGQIFFKPLQRTNSLYSSASAFFISRQLILTEETVGQGRILGSVYASSVLF